MKNNIESSACGVLAVDKPQGMTSFDVVAKIRKMFGTRQVGHTGTLDPMATGVMVLLIGRAVKASEYITADNKRYIAGMKLGLTSDTLDITGNILTRSEISQIPEEKSVMDVLEGFRGKIIQIPPMYSALKVNGVKLCDAARRGVEIEREGREVEIYKLEANKIADDEYMLDVFCSKGTYIRTLCDDIGAKLGCGAVMSSLRRVSSGRVNIEDCHTLEEIELSDMKARIDMLLPVSEAFSDIEKIELSPFFARLARDGNSLFQKKIKKDVPPGARVALYDSGRFFALAESIESPEGELLLKPIKQFDI